MTSLGIPPFTGAGAKAYVYTKLASLRFSDERANVYGIVCSFNHPHQSRGKDMTISISLLDESRTDSDNAVPCNFFQPTRNGLPVPLMVGDIIRIHRAKVSGVHEQSRLCTKLFPFQKKVIHIMTAGGCKIQQCTCSLAISPVIVSSMPKDFYSI